MAKKTKKATKAKAQKLDAGKVVAAAKQLAKKKTPRVEAYHALRKQFKVPYRRQIRYTLAKAGWQYPDL